MAPPGTPQDGATNAPTERFIAATLRDARMRMKEINKRRERLRADVSQTMAVTELHSVEGGYWQNSQARLEKVMSDDPTGSIRGWGRKFALEEKKFLDEAQRSLDAFRGPEELMAADREFWGIWRKQLDFMCDLSPGMPPPSGTKKRKASARSESRPVLTLATPASEAADAQGHSLSPTTQAFRPSAMQPPRSPGPFGAPSPISLASSPDPSIPPSGVFSKPRLPASKRRRTSAAEPEPKIISAFTPINSPKPSPQPLPAAQQVATATKSHSGGFQGVTDLVVGEIYQAYYKDATQEGWWMCTPLPWDDWEQEIGINMDFTRADMWRDLPKGQYKTGKGRRKKAILGWDGDFKEGGPRVTQRVFPVLFFDDEEGAPGNLQFSKDPMKTYTFPKKAMAALPAEWVAGKDLRMAGTVGEAGGIDTARRFRERFVARKARREEGS